MAGNQFHQSRRYIANQAIEDTKNGVDKSNGEPSWAQSYMNNNPQYQTYMDKQSKAAQEHQQSKVDEAKSKGDDLKANELQGGVDRLQAYREGKGFEPKKEVTPEREERQATTSAKKPSNLGGMTTEEWYMTMVDKGLTPDQIAEAYEKEGYSREGEKFKAAQAKYAPKKTSTEQTTNSPEGNVPSEPKTQKALNELFSVKGVDGNPIVEVGEDGSLKLTKPMTKAEFIKATGSGNGNIIKGILTGLSGALMLLGIPSPNLGKAYEQISGNNIDEVYNQYISQVDKLQSTFSTATGEAYGDVVKNKAKQANTISDVEDKDYWEAYRAKGMTDNEIQLQYDKEKAEIDKNVSVELAKLNSSLSTSSQKELADFVNGLPLKQKKTFVEYYSSLTPEQTQAIGRKIANLEGSMSQDEKNQKLYENIMHPIDSALNAAGTAAGTAVGTALGGRVGSDKNIKSFVMPKMFH